MLMSELKKRVKDLEEENLLLRLEIKSMGRIIEKYFLVNKDQGKRKND